MAIPDYQTIMLPLLAQLSDEKTYPLKEMIEMLAKEFQLSEEERNELVPSGQQSTFMNRVSWAKTYLKKAGLIESQKRGLISITKRGQDLLKTKPARIDIRLLKQFPEFIQFLNRSKDNISSKTAEPLKEPDLQTPEEAIESSYQTIRQALALELLETIRTMQPSFFERLVVELLVKMGYGGSVKEAGEAVGKTGDDGIDGIIKEDRLGLDIIYIQAKRWQADSSVGQPELQKFVGALAGKGAKKGVFITTSSFTQSALSYNPHNTTIVRIDGQDLAQLMIDYNLGVTSQRLYEIKRLDSDYFVEA